jgi:hypothetical protein
MIDQVTTAYCYFQTSDNSDGTFWIAVQPQDNKDLKIAGRVIDVGLDLTPTTSVHEADALAALLRKHVANVRIWER